MDSKCERIIFDSLDGLQLVGILCRPKTKDRGCVLLVHGINVDKDEYGNFYARLASALADEGFSSLRFDLRGHGESEGDYTDLTILGCVVDVEAAAKVMVNSTGHNTIHLIGTSFGGGLVSIFAGMRGMPMQSVVLLCPNLDYQGNWLSTKPYWSAGQITRDGSRKLSDDGWLPHGDLKINRAMLVEMLCVHPYEYMSRIQCPVLTIHGTADSIVPVKTSEKYYKCNDRSEIMLLEGADHGFVIPDDEEMTDPRSLENQSKVFEWTLGWLAKNE